MLNRDELVECRRVPWQPSSHARHVDPWLADDVPTFGTFQHDSTTVLFCAVDGVDRRMTVWAYIPLTADEASELDTVQFSSTDDLGPMVDALIAGGSTVEFALADAFEIIRKGEVSVRLGVTNTLVGATNEFMENIIYTLRDRTPAETKLSARMAEASEYGPELERQLEFAQS